MATETDTLARIATRLEAGTPGPWTAKSSRDNKGMYFVVSGPEYVVFRDYIPDRQSYAGPEAEANAAKTAAMGTLGAPLLRVVRALIAARAQTYEDLGDEGIAETMLRHQSELDRALDAVLAAAAGVLGEAG